MGGYCTIFTAFLVQLLSDMSVNPWLGMRSYWWTLSSTAKYFWINQADVTYTNFAAGEPNDKQVSSNMFFLPLTLLIHLCQMYFPTSPFPILGFLSGRFHFYSNSKDHSESKQWRP